MEAQVNKWLIPMTESLVAYKLNRQKIYICGKHEKYRE